jgi:hypothetical protein
MLLLRHRQDLHPSVSYESSIRKPYGSDVDVNADSFTAGRPYTVNLNISFTATAALSSLIATIKQLCDLRFYF